MLALLGSVSSVPEECLLSGLCWLETSAGGPAPGMMFLAVGLVVVGAWGLRRRGR